MAASGKSSKVRTPGGSLMLTRLGGLNYTEQSRWSRAPERYGMWAFPFGMVEMFFIYHQWSDRAPAELRRGPDGRPLRPAALVDEMGNPPDPADPRSVEELCEAGFETRPGWYEDQRRWVREVGMRSHPLRHFPYQGPLYAHFSPTGEILPLDQWSRLDSGLYAEFINRSGGNSMLWRPSSTGSSPGSQPPVRTPTSSDHLEVFLPRTRARS